MCRFERMTEVKVAQDSESELIGAYGRVYNLPGDESTNGEIVPDGWVEVIFSPFHQELFAETALELSEAELQ